MADQLTQSFIQSVELSSDIGGRFVDLRRIGDGAFSIVFSANDRTARRRVAVKFLRPLVPNTDPYRASCFHREAVILWDLTGQPDIITCLVPEADFPLPVSIGGVSVSLPVPYYAMELGSGSVAEAIALGGWEAERTLLAFGAMCRAVQRIHARGIVHRDLKPDNFITMPNRDVKLSDFGTARRLDEAPLETDYKIWPGDKRHTAPEMFALLHDEDPRIAVLSDMFSLGTILFELFTGTKLGLQLFDQAFANDLAYVMTQVRREERQRIFDQLIPTIVDAHPLPLISDFGSPVPAPIAGRVERLYRDMTALDYRKRLCEFSTVFHEIERCLTVARRQEAYFRLQEFRRRRQEGRTARAAAIAARGVDQ